MFGSIHFYKSAPTDGRDPFVNVDKKDAFYTSKQNSDANGFRYQWGRKDPFTFATSSEQWGTSAGDYGKYAVKIYTIDGVLIYQENNGSSNKDKKPAGGVMNSSISATSMMETIKNPITFYYGGNTAIISQSGKTRDLWDYYWTSYSRGTDGNTTWGSSIIIQSNFHTQYLDSYTYQRLKSIYDPCPFGFKVMSNGTYNDFQSIGWISYSYVGGTVWRNIWLPPSGYRTLEFNYVGRTITSQLSILFSSSSSYKILIFNGKQNLVNEHLYSASRGYSVRCIDFAMLASPPQQTVLV